ncbi:MAG: 5-formyltetrahydrofolate cyclo-ligase [Proteobacteria bacterium]|nr:5-formyltetrahydrofolate cyclo-ligase [Pseudomonadota bacterium]
MGKRVKAELRREMRKVLANLDRRWLQVASRELCRNISTLLDQQKERPIEKVLAWVNFFPGEVDLSTLINEQLDRREIFLPQLRDGKMQFSSVGKDWLRTMSQGELGIPEPSMSSGRIFSPADAVNTAVLVPGLAFDSSGGRLGRGKGYYDTFLGRSPLFDLLKIGVCWSLQKLSEIPMESHDAYMDWVVTEEGVIKSA